MTNPHDQIDRATVNDNSTYVPPSSGTYTQCPVTDVYPLLPGEATQGFTDWFYRPAPDLEQSLVNGNSPTWNVEVAVGNGKGSWDSKYGRNYRFTFNGV
ncbi:hypothetical protein HDU67_000948 [Dinochytrium kinnereticum]|nr:hypothetical protein HDU67_000948 [Dinochytrium kinnereticum]